MPRYILEREERAQENLRKENTHAPLVCVCVHIPWRGRRILSAPTADHFISCAWPARKILFFSAAANVYQRVCATVSSLFNELSSRLPLVPSLAFSLLFLPMAERKSNWMMLLNNSCFCTVHFLNNVVFWFYPFDGRWYFGKKNQQPYGPTLSIWNRIP